MAVPVTFAGQTYSIPQRGDTGWFALTDYLIALSQAQTRSQTTFNLRSVSAGTTVTATDTFVAADTTGGNVAVQLPSASANQGRLLGFIVTAGTNFLSLFRAGADTISGFAPEYPIQGVGRAVYLVAVGSNWQVLSAVGTPTPALGQPIAVPSNGTVASTAAVPYFTASTSVANLQSTTITFASQREPYELEINASSTQALLVRAYFGPTGISALSDPSGLFLPTDAGTGVAVTKSANSTAVTIKNRLGSSANFRVTATKALITSATAWS